MIDYAFSLSPLSKMLVVDLSYIAVTIQDNEVYCLYTLSFYYEWIWNFVKCFSTSIDLYPLGLP